MAAIKLTYGNIARSNTDVLILVTRTTEPKNGGVRNAIDSVSPRFYDQLYDSNDSFKALVEGETVFAGLPWWAARARSPRHFRSVVFVADDLNLPYSDVIRLALERADLEGAKSVAFINWRGGYKGDEEPGAVGAIARAISDFQQNSKSIKQIQINILNPHVILDLMNALGPKRTFDTDGLRWLGRRKIERTVNGTNDSGPVAKIDFWARRTRRARRIVTALAVVLAGPLTLLSSLAQNYFSPPTNNTFNSEEYAEGSTEELANDSVQTRGSADNRENGFYEHWDIGGETITFGGEIFAEGAQWPEGDLEQALLNEADTFWDGRIFSYEGASVLVRTGDDGGKVVWVYLVDSPADHADRSIRALEIAEQIADLLRSNTGTELQTAQQGQIGSHPSTVLAGDAFVQGQVVPTQIDLNGLTGNNTPRRPSR